MDDERARLDRRLGRGQDLLDGAVGSGDDHEACIAGHVGDEGGAGREHVPGPAVAVLVLSMSDDDESVFAAMRAGARGYVLKGADHEEIHRAIVAAAAGEAIFGPEVARRLMALFTAPRTRGPGADAFPELTERELEILVLIARGTSNPVIADRLGLSLKTVRNYVSNIFNKLQVADRAEAMLKAQAAGLGQPE